VFCPGNLPAKESKSKTLTVQGSRNATEQLKHLGSQDARSELKKVESIKLNKCINRNMFTPRIESKHRHKDNLLSSSKKAAELKNLTREVKEEAKLKQNLRKELDKVRKSIEVISKFKDNKQMRVKSKF